MESFGNNSPRNTLRFFILFVEIALVAMASELSYRLHAELGTQFQPAYFPFLGIAILAWLSVGMLVGSYHMAHLFEGRRSLRMVLATVLLHSPILWFFQQGNPLYQPVTFPVQQFGEYLLFALMFVGGFRWGMAHLYSHRKRLMGDYKAVIIGSGRSANAVNNFLRGQAKEVLQFTSGEQTAELDPVQHVRDNLSTLKQLCLKEDVREIYYTLPITDRQVMEEVWDFADNHYISFKIANDFDWLNNQRVAISFFDQTPVISMRHVPLDSRINKLLKRGFDILFSLGVLLTVFPLLYLAVGIAIKLDSRGPVFFKQYRSGRKNRKFLCYKFRTMTVNQEADARQATKGDARITKVGAFLRKTSLDEFPQFINVLKGEMSVVGPRPHMLKHTEQYSEQIHRFMFRHYVTPGITGWAQVSGYRGETKDPEMMRKRVEHDTWYIENWSLWLDIRCVILTVVNALKGEENAY